MHKHHTDGIVVSVVSHQHGDVGSVGRIPKLDSLLSQLLIHKPDTSSRANLAMRSNGRKKRRTITMYVPVTSKSSFTHTYNTHTHIHTHTHNTTHNTTHTIQHNTQHNTTYNIIDRLVASRVMNQGLGRLEVGTWMRAIDPTHDESSHELVLDHFRG